MVGFLSLFNYHLKDLVMKKISFYFLICGLIMSISSCSDKEEMLTSSEQISASIRSGATQISGLVSYAATGQCEDEVADFALLLTGDLEGCMYVYVEEYDCSPSGTYRETGEEHFVGTYNGGSGEFWSTYRYEAKYEGCEDGFFVGAELFGRCQHPIINGSGTGIFDGVSGRLDFKENPTTGLVGYTGHLKY